MIIALSLLWFIRTAKAILFWLYLWQLKEYHLGRFFAHFKTAKGRELIASKLLFLKIVLLAILLRFNLFGLFLLGFWGIIFVLYFLESIKAIKDFLKGKMKIPVPTKKTIFLTIAAFFLFTFILSSLWRGVDFTGDRFDLERFVAYLLILDIVVPLAVSAIVLFFQPLTIFWRDQVIKKAKNKRSEMKNLLVVGITGSYGKTSVKEFLYEILSDRFNVLKTKEHQNSEIGIARCILEELKPIHEVFIVEMGAYNRGVIKSSCDVIKPKIGILTGINEQHMATFGSQENIIRGKSELIESLPDDGIAIFNGDNKLCRELFQKTQKPKRLCGKMSPIIDALPEIKFNLWAEEISIEKEFLSFKVLSQDGDQADFRVNLLGGQNVTNILLSAQCAKELGMNLREISLSLTKIKPQQGAMKLLKGIRDLNIIDSTYSANPASVLSHLDYLKIWPSRKAIIMPSLIELGNASREVHKKIGEKIAEVCDLAIITTKEGFSAIKEGAAEKGMNTANVLFMENPEEIIKIITVRLEKDDILLLESRVPKELLKSLIERPANK